MCGKAFYSGYELHFHLSNKSVLEPEQWLDTANRECPTEMAK